MAGMRRSDRRDSNSDNALNHPRSRQTEPTSPNELKALLATVRSQRDEAKTKLDAKTSELAVTQTSLVEKEQALEKTNKMLMQVQQDFTASQKKIETWKEWAERSHRLYQGEQQKYQATFELYQQANSQLTIVRSKSQEMQAQLDTKERFLQETSTQVTQIQQAFQAAQVDLEEWKNRASHNHDLYLDEQRKYHETLHLYDQERARASQLLTQYEEADAQRAQYFNLYNETQTQLKHERRSKASIKGWETRRKAENERLKQEIGEMAVLLRESLERKDEAVNNLYLVAERMDRIQQLVDSVDEDSNSTPIGLLQKLRRIWLSIREILAE